MAAEEQRPAATATGTSLLDELAQLIAELDPSRPRYDRSSFEEGADLDGDCIRTRHEVLQLEADSYVMASTGCTVMQGEWWDPFTGQWFTDPKDLEVDHVVALADAWRSGAWAFSPTAKEAFANQLANLNAIYGPENQAKADLGPADYTPTNPDQRCSYLAQYAAVKVAWGLTITQSDYDAVASGLAACPSTAPPTPDVAINDLASALTTTTRPASTNSASQPTATTPTTGATPTTPSTTTSATDCHPAYIQCLPNLPGDALNCGDVPNSLKPIRLRDPAVDPYNIDGRGQIVDDGLACE